MTRMFTILAITAAAFLSTAAAQQKTGVADSPAAVPSDPWPRKLDLASASVLVYQPQINSCDGHMLDFRAAVAIQPMGAKEETFGVLFATARTQVDKVTRTVVLENIAIYKSDFPLLPDRGAAY